MESLITWLQQHDRRFIYGGGTLTFMHHNEIRCVHTDEQAQEALAELRAES